MRLGSQARPIRMTTAALVRWGHVVPRWTWRDPKSHHCLHQSSNHQLWLARVHEGCLVVPRTVILSVPPLTVMVATSTPSAWKRPISAVQAPSSKSTRETIQDRPLSCFSLGHCTFEADSPWVFSAPCAGRKKQI